MMNKFVLNLMLIFAATFLTSCSGTRTLVVDFRDLRTDFFALEKTLQEDEWADQTHQGTATGGDQLRSDFLALEKTLREDGWSARSNNLAENGFDRQEPIHRTTLAWNPGEGQELH